jgi:hypothetical protein
MQALRVMFAAEIIPHRSILKDWNRAVDSFLSSPCLHSSSVDAAALTSLQPLLLPVISSGRDANLGDLISLDLLAAAC